MLYVYGVRPPPGTGPRETTSAGEDSTEEDSRLVFAGVRCTSTVDF
jgi:hypothetical protein